MASSGATSTSTSTDKRQSCGGFNARRRSTGLGQMRRRRDHRERTRSTVVWLCRRCYDGKGMIRQAAAITSVSTRREGKNGRALGSRARSPSRLRAPSVALARHFRRVLFCVRACNEGGYKEKNMVARHLGAKRQRRGENVRWTLFFLTTCEMNFGFGSED